MKPTRKQKSRRKNDASQAIRGLASNYFSIVDAVFSYGEWIYKVMPEYDNALYEPTVKWFIAQTLVYLSIFGKKNEEGKLCVHLNKEGFEQVMTDNEQVNSYPYSETFTKEMMVSVIKTGVKKFFEQDMFPVIDEGNSNDK